MPATEALIEAERLMTVCNSCRYCEGLCAVFPAMEMRTAFSDGDLNYLANLCHSCGACHADCQFTAPHEFNVNVPQTLAKVRNDSYAAYAWPRAFAPLLGRNRMAADVISGLCILGFVYGLISANELGVRTAQGDFYSLMPHNAMAALFGAAFCYAIFALAMGLRNFWRDIGESNATLSDGVSLWQAMKDAASLRYLDGGGVGCFNEDDRPNDRRRLYHHLTMYGFLLCFAATCVATLYHFLLGREAPYAWYDLPVLLGTLGGIGLTVGTSGLLWAKRRRNPELQDQTRQTMESALSWTLLQVAVTGLLLLALRATQLMETLLALHLGSVLLLFVIMPYGKFVHGIYRFAALVRYAKERKALM